VRAWIAALALALLGPALAPATASAAACPAGPFTGELSAALASRYPGRAFSAEVVDLRDGCTYDLAPGRRMTTASVFKVEVMAGVLLKAQQEGRELNGWEASRVRPMIAESADGPTNQLFSYLGGVAGFARLHRTFGLTETSTPSGTWGLTTTTARDEIRLLRQVLLGGGPLGDVARRRAGVEMTSVVPAQRWGITEGAPAGWVVAQKNGFAPSRDHGWRLNSVGQVGGAWLVATFSDGWGSEAAGIEGNRFLNRAISTSLARVPVGPFPTAEAFVRRQFADVLGRAPRYDERLAWSALTQSTNAPAPILAWLLGLSGKEKGVAGDPATVTGIVVGRVMLGRPWGPQPDRLAFIGGILGSDEYRRRVA
jgi:beta-lactamase class A